MTFDEGIGRQTLKTVRFVNHDAATTSVFVDLFKSQHDSLTMAAEDTDQRKRVKDAKVDDRRLQHRLSDTRRNQRSSQAEIEADQQLLSTDADDRQLAVRLSSGVGVDYKSTMLPESFAATWRSVTATDTVVPGCANPFSMVTSCDIDVQIYRGDLLNEKVDAIVNPANCQLFHGGGAARAVATAAGRQLEEECKAYISEHKELKLTQAMHTTAGKLCPPIIYVIHVAGPSAAQFRNPDDLYQAVFDTFYHCLLYANNFLHVSSLSVPAISSGE